MGNPGEIQRLEAQIAADKQKFSETERLRTALIEKMDRKGFGDVATELRYRGEIEELGDQIHRDEERLAGEKSHPDWPRE